MYQNKQMLSAVRSLGQLGRGWQAQSDIQSATVREMSMAIRY
jgi:hypothetical protein